MTAAALPWYETIGGILRRFVLLIVSCFAAIAFFVILMNAVVYGISLIASLPQRWTENIAFMIALPLTLAGIAGSVFLGFKQGWIKEEMSRHATLPCTTLDPDDEIGEGWYVAEVQDKRIMAQVVSGNWGMQIRALGQDWSIGQPNCPVRLIARADLDKLHIHPPEADYIRAQIGTIKGFLERSTEQEDPIGHRQWRDRLEDLEAELSRLEGRA